MKYLSLFIVFYSVIYTPVYAQNYPPDIQRIYNNKKIRVALVNEDYPPFFMKDNLGHLIGYDISMANDIAQQLGVGVEFTRESKTFDDLILTIQQHKADLVISNLSVTLIRATKINYSQPYLLLHQALAINQLQAAKLEITSQNLTAVNQKQNSIGVLKGSSYEKFAKDNFPNAYIVGYTELNSAIRDVQSGKIFAVMHDEVAINNVLENIPGANLYVKKLILHNKFDPISMGINYQDTHLLNWVNLYLNKIKVDGTKDFFTEKFLKGKIWQ